MAAHFHTLTVKKITKETADCVSVAFTVPPQLQTVFAFEHGQNITLKKNIDGQEIRRSYSICSAPYENELKVAIKKITGGKFSTFANETLQAGDNIEVMPPTGKFNTPLHKDNCKNYLSIAAGSGITPILSIIKTTLQTEPLSSFTLVFANRSRSSIIFFEELESLKNKYISRFSFVNILSREKTDTALNFGRVNEAKLGELSKIIHYKNMNECFICGPQEMIFCTRDFLEKQYVNKRNIHFELFTSSTLQLKKQSTANNNTAAGVQSNITIKADGRTFDIAIAQNSNSTILDAALKQGADLPFACKGGMCCTCKARLIEGKVDMDVTWGLEQEEIEKGFILTCQSHPATAKVVVDFDIK